MGSGVSTLDNYNRQCEAGLIMSKRPKKIRQQRGTYLRRGIIYQKCIIDTTMTSVERILDRHNQFREEFAASPVNKYFEDYLILHFSSISNASCLLAIELLKRCLVKHIYKKHDIIQIEGENSKKLILFEKGEAYCSINKTRIREIKCPLTYNEWLVSGAEKDRDIDCGPVGEMEMVYDVALTPNVKVTSDACTAWLLSRQEMQLVLTSVHQSIKKQRIRWLARCPELASLGEMNLHLLARHLQVEHYKQGEQILSRSRLINRFLVVERGETIVFIPPEIKNMKVSVDSSELDRLLGVVRPRGLRRRCIMEMIPEQYRAYHAHSHAPLGYEDDEQYIDTKYVNEDGAYRGTPGEGIIEDPFAKPPPPHSIIVGGGCVLGIDALRSKSHMTQIEYWQWKEPHYTDEMYLEPVGDSGLSFAGTILPFDMVAKTPVTALSFTMELLEQLFGSAFKVAKKEIKEPMQPLAEGYKEPILIPPLNQTQEENTHVDGIYFERHADGKEGIELRVDSKNNGDNYNTKESANKEIDVGLYSADEKERDSGFIIIGRSDSKDGSINHRESKQEKYVDDDSNNNDDDGNNNNINGDQKDLDLVSSFTSYKSQEIGINPQVNDGKVNVPRYGDVTMGFIRCHGYGQIKRRENACYDFNDKDVEKEVKILRSLNRIRDILPPTTSTTFPLASPYFASIAGAASLTSILVTDARLNKSIEYTAAPDLDLYSLIYHPPSHLPKTTDDTYMANYYFAQAVIAIRHIHACGYVLRSLCPESIAIARNGNLLIKELSCAHRPEGPTPVRYTICGCLEYMAPEILTMEGHDYAVDLWALGVLLYELHFGYTPFAVTHDNHNDNEDEDKDGVTTNRNGSKENNRDLDFDGGNQSNDDNEREKENENENEYDGEDDEDDEDGASISETISALPNSVAGNDSLSVVLEETQNLHHINYNEAETVKNILSTIEGLGLTNSSDIGAGVYKRGNANASGAASFISHLSDGIYSIPGQVAQVVSGLLHALPSQRCGYLSLMPTDIFNYKRTKLFDALEMDLLEQGLLPPSIAPYTSFSPASSISSTYHRPPVQPTGKVHPDLLNSASGMDISFGIVGVAREETPPASVTSAFSAANSRK